jgi:3-isopropylmalate/(R)-2-methylmalate dehydratase small subunit
MSESIVTAGSGQTWVFGDSLNTDVLHPPSYFSLEPEIVKSGLFKGIDPDLQARVQPGDFIVGGHNFGCGSSRETSIRSLKLNGIAAVIAIDFARIFFRSATNHGIPCLSLSQPSELALFRHGGRATLQLEDDCVVLENGKRIALQPVGAFVRKIWSAGGLLGLLP